MTSCEPNGLCFSPDEKKLYICDTGFTDGPDNPSHIRVFDVDLAAGKLSNSKVFADMPKPSITDGLRCDTDGRLWCSVGWGDPNEDGVRCYTPDGDLLGKIHIPETVANLCFGGQQRNRLLHLRLVIALCGLHECAGCDEAVRAEASIRVRRRSGARGDP